MNPRTPSSHPIDTLFPSTTLVRSIVLAGPVTNFLFAIAIFAAFNMTYGVATVPPVIGGVQAGSAAEAAGLRIGDRIDHINGQSIASFGDRSEEHTSELQSLMRISYAVFCLKKKT